LLSINIREIYAVLIIYLLFFVNDEVIMTGTEALEQALCEGGEVKERLSFGV